jgi:hypothetical protein
MADEYRLGRYRKLYARLLRLYPRPYRERFAESMAQTFGDLCRERTRAGQGLFTFALWAFAETSVAIVSENATRILRCTMKRDSTLSLRVVKYSAMAVSVLMVTGIVTLMVLSRGTGEDITGIVAPALLITILSSAVAIVATVAQKRAQKGTNIDSTNDRAV